MVWISFRTLDEKLGIESNGPEGCWTYVDSYHHTGFSPRWNKGIPHTEETKALLSERARNRKPVTEETRRKMRENAAKTHKGKAITVNGVTYKSVSEAARQLNTSRFLVSKMSDK